jgi:hypothetical protein
MNYPIQKPDAYCIPCAIPGAVLSIALDLCDSPPSSYEPMHPRRLFIIHQIKLRTLLYSIPAVLIKNYYYLGKLHASLIEAVFLCDEIHRLLMLKWLSRKSLYILQFHTWWCNTSIKVLWRIDPLLCNDREMGGYTRTVCGKRLGKHVPAATDTYATIEEFCFQFGPCWDVIRKVKV